MLFIPLLAPDEAVLKEDIDSQVEIVTVCYIQGATPYGFQCLVQG